MRRPAILLAVSLCSAPAIATSSDHNSGVSPGVLRVEFAPLDLLSEQQPPLEVSFAQSSTRSHTDGPAKTTSIAGNLHRRVVGEFDGNVIVAMRLSEASASSVDPELPHHRALVQAPFLVHYDAAGAVVQVEFAKAIPWQTRYALHDIVSALQVVVPSDEQDTWVATQYLEGRQQDVAYRGGVSNPTTGAVRLHRELIRQRKTYSGPGHAIRYGVRSSHGYVDWSASGSGVSTAAFEDIVEVHYKGQLAEVMHTSVTASLGSSVLGAQLPTTVDGAYDAIFGNRAKRLRYYKMSPPEIRTVKDLNFEQVMAFFMETVDDAASTAAAAVKNFVRLHPEYCDAVAEYLNELEQIPENRIRIGYAYSALAAAGHREAQHTIANVLREARFNVYNQDRAARSTLSIERPERFMTAALWDYREAMATEGGEARQQRALITNVYGALGGWEHAEPGNTLEVFDTLLREYRQAPNPLSASELLPALGNIGDLQLLWPIFEPLFDSDSEVVRRRAYMVFQKAHTEEAFGMFAERYAREPVRSVRLSASAVADSMPWTQARLRWALDNVLITPEKIIRERMVRSIGDQLAESPEEGLKVLRALLKQSIDDEVRRMIYRYVTPEQGGAL